MLQVQAIRLRPAQGAILLVALVAGFVLALAVVTPGRAGTHSLSTPFATWELGNELFFFDVQAGPADLVIDQIDAALLDPNPGTVEIWTRPGTFQANTDSLAGWTQVGDFDGVASVSGDTPTVLPPLQTPVDVLAGQVQGFLIISSEANTYLSEGNATGTAIASDAFLSIFTGASKSSFGSTLVLDRDEMVTIHYTPGNPPQWTLQAKIAGGNTLNPFLPDYTPGTWSTKWVTVYLDCVPGDSPIDIERKDSSRTFYDGIHMWEHDPDDECVDEAGNPAEDLAPYGPIMVDTKAPNCRVTPGTLYIPRNTTATVNFALDLTEIGPSGFMIVAAGSTESGGAILNSVSFLGGVPATGLQVDATMPNSTAAKIVFNIFVSDVAGNTKTCTATVKAK
jgi:hypothetical protein